MSLHKVEVVRLSVEPHPNADKLDLAKIEHTNYVSIIQKGLFKTGDLAVYIPESSVVPEDVLDVMGLAGRLAGKDKNRVKAIRLRGVTSQGLVYPIDDDGRITRAVADGTIAKRIAPGLDVGEILGIKKYSPPIPMSMQGEVYYKREMTYNYDVENFKRYPDLIKPGDEVVVTEKIHGTFCGFGCQGGPIFSVFSKGLGAKGLCFKMNEESINKNVYCSTWLKYSGAIIDLWEARGQHDDDMFFLFGEIYGAGIQDMKYGLEKEKKFVLFDMYEGMPGNGSFVTWNTLTNVAATVGFETVPLVYQGPWNPDMSLEKGNSLIATAGNKHIREGIVIKKDIKWGEKESDQRPIVKIVSEDYLFRGGKTTELE